MDRKLKFVITFLIFMCVGALGYNKLNDRRYIDTVKKLELPTVVKDPITFEEITRTLLQGEPKWDRKGNCVTAERNNIKMIFPYTSNNKDIIVQYEDIFLITDKGDTYRLVDIYTIALNEYLKQNIKDIM
ncbi:hypothetical protein [Fusobacterium sp.]|uniref:hypothetical protein n=1 Tax=Fusobacterium sp. TaxID=68766 RepID=UPI00260AF47A|nr:hypothetical protein [Fusobacterium sp.]